MGPGGGMSTGPGGGASTGPGGGMSTGPGGGLSTGPGGGLSTGPGGGLSTGPGGGLSTGPGGGCQRGQAAGSTLGLLPIHTGATFLPSPSSFGSSGAGACIRLPIKSRPPITSPSDSRRGLVAVAIARAALELAIACMAMRSSGSAPSRESFHGRGHLQVTARDRSVAWIGEASSTTFPVRWKDGSCP
jgi:hypothetical protein